MHTMRILLTGVGGQGTLTATNLLAKAALLRGLEVTSGEVHGMAQRGGVVESTILLGGLKSPRVGPGEADVLLGFEPLETYRALPMLRPGGKVVSSTDFIEPVNVSLGKESRPDLATIQAAASACAGGCLFLPCRALGEQAGAVQSGNLALLGAALALGLFPFGPDALEEAVRATLKPAIAPLNLKAIALGVEAAASQASAFPAS
ncbi:MAG: indolepyruvate oxidoreductase subunit beta [Desulfovibrio sp.]|nr:indolepyruvate oxidoreductase subunit beta [Desulfovibrio sp.]MCA1986070.1 indolepyruvate oxidoreductase subunit beta [Desulfovibrio sp.]